MKNKYIVQRFIRAWCLNNKNIQDMAKSNMFHLVIDSTYFKKNPALDKKEFKLLTDLSQKRFIKIHIPWIVYKECTTSSVAVILEKLNSAQKSLTNLKRIGLHVQESEILDKLSQSLGHEIIKVEKSVEMNWNDFIKSSKANVHKFNPNQSVAVFDSYFSGGKPFKNLKSRLDIPDAFIYETIKEIGAKQTIHLITEDQNLTTCFIDQDNVFTHKDFSEFYNSHNFKIAKSSYEDQSRIADLKLFVRKQEEEILDIAKRHIREVSPYEIHVSEDNNTTILAIYDPKISLKIDELVAFDDVVYLPISIKARVEIEYYISITEATHIAETKANDLKNGKVHLTKINDYAFEVEKFANLEMSQILIIQTSSIDQNENLSIEFGEYEEFEFDE